MSRRLYRALLWLLPPRRRSRFGEDMTLVFDELRADERRERGAFGVAWLWTIEAVGMARFIMREWLQVVGIGGRARGRGPGVMTELRWAWRGIRGRGARAVFIVGLLAITLAVNAATFSVVDSLIFHRYPYPDVARIVSLKQFVEPNRGPHRLQAAALHDAWQAHRDLFAAVGGFWYKSGVFLLDENSSKRVETADVTIGLFDVLGVRPAWGRGFTESDLKDTGAFAAVISDDLARDRFGSPREALGQRIDATGGPLVVVGVMPSTFAFPSASTTIWRSMDPLGPLTMNFAGMGLMARLAVGVPLDTLTTSLAERAPAVGEAAGLPSYQVSAAPYFADATSEAANRRRTLLLLLLGSAVALLLASCANVASVELAHAIGREHARAVQLALGASRGALVRIALLETAALVGLALIFGFGLAWALLQATAAYLPDSLRYAQNPIDLDVRVVWYSAATALAIWVVMSIAATVSFIRQSAMAVPGGRRATAARSAGVRRALTALQIGLAVALVIVGLMYARSYQALLAIEKGFDSTGLAVVSTEMPASYFASFQDRAVVVDRLLEDVRRLPGIVGAKSSSPPPSTGESFSTSIEIDGQVVAEDAILGRIWTDSSYFDVTGLPLVAGRLLEPGEPTTNVVVPETFARRFWPNGNAVGQSFRGAANGPFREPMTVVGVVGDFRFQPTRMPDIGDSRMFVYVMRVPPPPAIAAQQAAFAGVDNGGFYSGLAVTVRVASLTALPAIQAMVQRMDPRFSVRVSLVDEIYARQHADTLLATRVVGAFSSVSFLVAMAGLYGVIAFMVASRTREIGIRMALGAAQRDIRRMVLASSGRIVVIGSLAGVAAAFGAARWIESQLFGVSPSDPTTYLVVVVAVAITALVAAWQPARQAASIDPAITLRAE